jgi:membrane protease YdiL (CAAX protease family)
MRLKELRMDWKTVTAIVVSTLALTEGYYRHDILRGVILASSQHGGPLWQVVTWTLTILNREFWYLIVPLATVLLIFRESPAKYGFRLGDWRVGLLLTLGGWVGVTILMLVIARSGAFRAYYTPQARPLPQLIYENALDLFGWEFIFRGFLLFALYRTLGPTAIVLQAVPFAIAHFGKPELETLSCIFGGSAFGYVAWRTRSFLYPFLIHWYLTTITILFASGALR